MSERLAKFLDEQDRLTAAAVAYAEAVGKCVTSDHVVLGRGDKDGWAELSWPEGSLDSYCIESADIDVRVFDVPEAELDNWLEALKKELAEDRRKAEEKYSARVALERRGKELLEYARLRAQFEPALAEREA